MNKKLLTSIAAALALLLAGPVWSDGEDDELEMTMEVIDNPDEITDGFILTIGQVDDDFASEEPREPEEPLGDDEVEPGGDEGDHSDVPGDEGDHGDVPDGDGGVRDGGEDRFVGDDHNEFDLIDDHDGSDEMEEPDVLEEQVRDVPEEQQDESMPDENGDDAPVDFADDGSMTDENGDDAPVDLVDEEGVVEEEVNEEETENPDDQEPVD